MMTTWRVFIGDPGRRTHTDLTGLTWLKARDVLLAFVREETSGGEICDHCAGQARTAENSLVNLPEGSEWNGDLDWDELKLIKVPTAGAE
jgi:hypothetical protein